MNQPESVLHRVEPRRPGRVGLLVVASVVVVAGLTVAYVTREIALERAAREAFPIVAGQLRVERLAAAPERDRYVRGIPHELSG